MKILGLDLGTNSIGWAIIEREESQMKLLDKGVHIFQEGVKIEQGVESSKAAERTDHKALRRHYFRRRLRKAETLMVLSKYGFCPFINDEAIKDWKNKSIYPLSEELIEWQKTDEALGKNPYYCRFIAIDRKLDMNDITDRYDLGRALYHIAQRRGFLSNRLESTKESDGKVNESISEISEHIKDSGSRTLGEYFYKCYGKEKIRGKYTSRLAHYKAEFDAICEKQELSAQTKKDLERAIFFQRPLKSQKGLVGRCTFERDKARCPISHPRYEYYRMLCLINNIKIQTPSDDSLRSLNKEERSLIKPLFYRVAEKFAFEDIAKKIAGKGNYAFYKDSGNKPYLFNYRMDASVSGCPLSARLKNVFGDDWQTEIYNCYTLRKNKTLEQVVSDIWHVLFSFDKVDSLLNFAQERLGLDDEKAKDFSKITIKQDYAALSLKAINKILPFLEQGMIYSHAVFLANIGALISKDIWEEPRNREVIIQGVINEINDYNIKCGSTIQQNIISFLRDNFEIKNSAYDKLYHPSMIETYKQSENGLLGTPRTNAIRNPMAMRTMFQLRRLINELLKDGKIDSLTTINVEMTRELNNANMRRAMEQRQREQQRMHDQYRKLIQESTECSIVNPTETDILKYQLWVEQNHKCIYTGKTIRISDFLGNHPQYDIEHTIPRSIGGDDSQMNKTLACAEYNRKIKGAKMPYELADYESILVHLGCFKENLETLEKAIAKQKRAGSFSTKEEKDRHIVKLNRLKIERNYWKGKIDRFQAKEFKPGFKNSQLVDAGIISKYTVMYLKTLFPRVFTIRGTATADFRKLWGLQSSYEKKERVNHIHHCIDAITIACIGRNEYDELVRYYRLKEESSWYNRPRPTFEKPWPAFTEDVKGVEEELLVSYYTSDNLGKNTKKRMRVRGKVIVGKYLKGDTARGSLHQDTYYGAIQHGDEVRYVLRKELTKLKDTDVDKIVDDVVRAKVSEAVGRLGFKTAIESEIWMNEEKRIPIKKVRCYTPTVTNPLHIRHHRDVSDYDYKRQYHVVNDGNYMMAIYEGCDKKGRLKRKFEIVNNLNAAELMKCSSGQTGFDEIVPLSKDGLPLKHAVKTGTLVLIWKDSPEEIWEMSKRELKKRLYRITVMMWDGRLKLVHHQLSAQEGISATASVDFSNLSLLLRLSPSSLNVLVEGYDFELTISGEIKPL